MLLNDPPMTIFYVHHCINSRMNGNAAIDGRGERNCKRLRSANLEPLALIAFITKVLPVIKRMKLFSESTPRGCMVTKGEWMLLF